VAQESARLAASVEPEHVEARTLRRQLGAHPDLACHPDRPFHTQIKQIGGRYYWIAADGSFRRLKPEDVAKIEGRGNG
jgi:hypothetical protein